MKDRAKEYLAALKDYLTGGGEGALEDAYMLGRRALEQGLGVVDMVDTHHKALATFLHRRNAPAEDSQEVIKLAGDFLAECLSPFEMAQRGFKDTITALNSLNESLEDEIERRTQAVRESEERYRTLVQLSPDAISVTDLSGRIVLSNEEAARLHGYQDPAEEIGIDAARFVAPEDMPVMQQMAQRVLKTGVTGELEYSLLTRQGSRVPVQVRVTPIKDAQGQPTGFIGVVRDITERKRAEEERQQLVAENERQRQRLKTLVAQVPGVIWEAWGEPDSAAQRIDFVSDHVEALLGYSVQEWLATPNFWLTIVHPDDKDEAAKRSTALFASGEPGINQFRWVAKDGRSIWVEAQSVVIKDEDGRPIGMRGVTMDITQRKAADAKLETQARQQTAAAQFGQRALSEVGLPALTNEALNLVKHTLDVEFCELLELQPDGKTLLLRDGIGWKEGSVGSATVKAGSRSQAGHTLQSGEPVITADLARQEHFTPPALLTENGVVSGVTVIVHSKDQPYGVLGAYTRHRRDFSREEVVFLQTIANTLAMAIRNRHLLESEASRRQIAERSSEDRLKSLAIVAHELRTPLSSIKGFASTLLADDVEWSRESQVDFIKTINEEADKLNSLIEQLLDLSRLEAGGSTLALETWPLADIISHSAAQLNALTRQHELVIDIAKTLPPVHVDKQRVGQVLTNLVGNAAKYSPAHSRITILAEADGDFVRINVIDQGPGIAPDERDKVFLPFYRAQSQAAPKSKGVGLGLFICQRLVEAHGGRIWIEQHEGPGTTILFTLPLASVSKRRGKPK